MPEVIDFRVRLPLELRPSAELPSDYLEQYDRVLDLSANRHRTQADLVADMDASGVTHAVVHAEYEYGDVADELNEAVARVVSDDPGQFSGYGTITMSPVKIPRALAQVQRVAELGLIGLSLQRDGWKLKSSEGYRYWAMRRFERKRGIRLFRSSTRLPAFARNDDPKRKASPAAPA